MTLPSPVLVTGGAGFIGSAVVRKLIGESAASVVVVDCLTYAGNLDSLAPVRQDARFHFERVDICDAPALRAVFDAFRPRAVIHLAAESHVDRSIDGPADFVRTNLLGTYTLLVEARRLWQDLSPEDRSRFRFLHVSTDEVFGSLDPGQLADEASAFRPNSPYAATKAGADHLVRAWHRTYGLPTLTTNCSNNYGPYQFPEKLIPLVIARALAGQTLPVYGDGGHVRDWLHVSDHCRALRMVLERGRVGGTYNIGGKAERRNIEVVEAVCALLDERRPRADGRSHASRIEFVADRPGHDRRYAVDSSRMRRELGWEPEYTFERGLAATVDWYLAHQDWVARVLDGSYRLQRLGGVA